MKRFIARPLTLLCSKLIYLLHNRNTFPFDRLELQSVQFSFSQFGEDLAVLRLAQQFGLAPGIYVDAGAYHPIFGSNTLLLHKQGWCGVNIDLAPERIAVFNRYRPKDYNIVACLSDIGAKVEIAHYEIASTDRVINSNNSEKLSIVGERPIRFSTATTTTSAKTTSTGTTGEGSSETGASSEPAKKESEESSGASAGAGGGTAAEKEKASEGTSKGGSEAGGGSSPTGGASAP